MREILDRYQLDVEIGGRVSFARQITNSLHRHNFYEFCYCLEGRGEYVHDAKRWPLSPGDVFVSEPNVRHEISSYGHQNLEIYFLWLVIGDLTLEVPSLPRNPLARFMRSHEIKTGGQHRLRPYVDLLESGSGQSDRIVLSFTLDMMEALSTPGEDGIDKPNASEFEKVFQFINANVGRKIAERELADLVGVSERTLRRRFHAATGTTLQAEINHRRMRIAAHRLLSGFSVQEVSSGLGISDASHFHRCFVRAFGISPKKFQLTYLPGRAFTGTRP